jgi:hypothetical protein
MHTPCPHRHIERTQIQTRNSVVHPSSTEHLQSNASSPVPLRYCLASNRRTCAADKAPPRGSSMPRAFNAARNDVAPAARTASMCGAISAARPPTHASQIISMLPSPTSCRSSGAPKSPCTQSRAGSFPGGFRTTAPGASPHHLAGRPRSLPSTLAPRCVEDAETWSVPQDAGRRWPLGAATQFS